MLFRLIGITIPVCAVLAFSLIALVRKRKSGAFVQLIGSAFLLIVVLAHVAEAYHLFPRMGWGLPNSPGLFLDLFSAIVGIILLVFWYFSRRNIRRGKSRASAAEKNDD
jgi:uncharacterized membrane protein